MARWRTALAKPFLPVVFFFAGVTYDTLTLTRIDRLLDNLILLLYLALLGLLIVVKGRADLGQPLSASLAGRPALAQVVGRTESFYPMAIQFLLGGLFSAYTIFYSRSASFTATAVFFGLLVVLLVANEFLRDRLSNLTLLLALYAVVSVSFFTFFLPVVTGLMNAFVFLVGTGLAALWTWRVAGLVYHGIPGYSRWDTARAAAPAGAVVALLIGFYVLNWIPPVPLSMKFGGIYREVTKDEAGYRLTFQAGRWYEPLKRSENPFYGEGPAYCFTAVFAPVDLKTTVYHRWQYRPERPAGKGTAVFATTDRIAIQISGGREAGYRGYTVKQRVQPGDWRVDVETEDGRIIGRIGFRVEEGTGAEGASRTIVY
ncbi:DUF2914 domain-containing protein [Candidatus Nitrospira bockiana]